MPQPPIGASKIDGGSGFIDKGFKMNETHYFDKYLEQRFKNIEGKQDAILKVVERIETESHDARREIRDESKSIKRWLAATIVGLLAITVMVVYGSLQVISEIVNALSSK